MARIKVGKRSEPNVLTWTRFHLPVDQERPTWAVAHKNVHFGPLNDVDGFWNGWIGRMVEDPEQAAYIIEWQDLEHFKKFQSSPACAEFLQNLPSNNGLQVSSESSLGASAVSSPSLQDASSRFLTLQESTGLPTSPVEGRVTFNAFLVPHKRGHETTRNAYEALRDELWGFQPRGFEFMEGTGLHWERHKTAWCWTLEEDYWVQSKLGKLEQSEETTEGRTVICDFHLWSPEYGATPELEEAAAASPEARESWNEAVAKVMPPVTAWVQERWDIIPLPFYEPPYEVSKESAEHKRKRAALIKHYKENPQLIKNHKENAQPEVRWCGTT